MKREQLWILGTAIALSLLTLIETHSVAIGMLVYFVTAVFFFILDYNEGNDRE